MALSMAFNAAVAKFRNPNMRSCIFQFISLFPLGGMRNLELIWEQRDASVHLLIIMWLSSVR